MPKESFPPVAIDLRQAAGEPTGVGRYLLGVTNAAAVSGLRVRGYVRSGERPNIGPQVELIEIDGPGILWHLRTWRHLRASPAVFLSTSFLMAQMPDVRALPVVLDLTTFLFPEHHTFRTRIAESTLMPRAIRRWPVVTCTQATADDIRKQFGEAFAITVVPPVIPASTVGTTAIRPVPPFVLFVGTIEPRKNLTTVIRAVRRLRDSGRDIRLTVVGKVGWHADAIRAEMSQAISDGSAQWLGYVSDGDRDQLYGEALALVMPSVYEGFGLPVLEAMASGIPCICSDTPALAEASGGAAILVPTFDVTGWADAIAQVADSHSLRANLTRAGRQRASQFTAIAAAESLRRALRRATLGMGDRLGGRP